MKTDTSDTGRIAADLRRLADLLEQVDSGQIALLSASVGIQVVQYGGDETTRRHTVDTLLAAVFPDEQAVVEGTHYSRPVRQRLDVDFGCLSFTVYTGGIVGGGGDGAS